MRKLAKKVNYHNIPANEIAYKEGRWELMEDRIHPQQKIDHYYGDIVRMLFLVSAMIMLIGLPVVSNYIAIPAIISVVGILVLGLAAGLTNPKQTWDAAINVAVAIVGFVVFESYAVSLYQKLGMDNKFFIANLILGFIFLFAVYFSVKTLRGLLLKPRL